MGSGGKMRDGRPPLPVSVGAQMKEDGDGEAANGGDDGEASEAVKNHLKQQVLALTTQVEEIEKNVNEVSKMRSMVRKSKGKVATAAAKEKERDKGGSSAANKKQQQVEAERREAARVKRMQELMRQVGTVLRQLMWSGKSNKSGCLQITQHKWAWPFMKPVDVKGLGLHDYHEVVKHPMDFGTIRDRMDAKDGTGYKHIQEICDDVRLVFSNATSYNQDGSDVHTMAKTLSDKFEEKWKAIVEPKLAEEEAKRKQEDKEAQTKEDAAIQAADEAAAERMADDFARQLEELDKKLEDLKQQTTPKNSRAMSIEEKRHLGHSLGRLPPDNLNHVIQIIAQKNPEFNATADEVEVDIDAQDPATLWRLHRYVQAVLSPRTTKTVTPRTPSGKRAASSPAHKSPSKRSKRVVSPP
ncbi:hypothetical protein CY35_02G013400 [Sphagnum magellanicum]|nr:hypothetical protein CY35_02G013400 [Sphagnum magellanicum]KAH9569891.1 hypothetical protein CY35_02G013400 [Sphagnum magellanicum]